VLYADNHKRDTSHSVDTLPGPPSSSRSKRSFFLSIQPLFAIVVAHGHPQDEVDNDRGKQRDRQNGRAQTVIESSLSAHADAPRAPVESEQGVHHSHHSNDGEQTGADLADLVAEVEKTDRESAEDDGEVEP
jgi:hypothetical protein